MLVPPIVRDLLFFGGFAAGLGGMVAVWLGGRATMDARQRKREALPDATLAGRPLRNGPLWQLVGGALLLSGPVFALWIWANTHRIAFVSDDGERLVVRRATWIGSPFPAENALESPSRRASWIVNQSSRPVQAQVLGYGSATTQRPEPIPPGRSLSVGSIDYVGPEDPPPDSIRVVVSEDIARLGPTEQRVWLTW